MTDKYVTVKGYGTAEIVEKKSRFIANVKPVASEDEAAEYIDEIKLITEKNEIIHTIQGAEPIGPKKLTDIMIIAPCSRKYNS